MDTSWLLWGLLFGSIGIGFFVYGRKQRANIPLVCGLALMIFPYFAPSTGVLIAIGACLCIAPFVIRA